MKLESLEQGQPSDLTIDKLVFLLAADLNIEGKRLQSCWRFAAADIVASQGDFDRLVRTMSIVVPTAVAFSVLGFYLTSTCRWQPTTSTPWRQQG